MPRAKTSESPGIGHNSPPVDELLSLTPDKLIGEYIAVRDWMQQEAKRFSEHMQPFKDRLTAIENSFLARFNEENIESLKTDSGTAYKSVKTTPKIIDRTAYLDFCLDNWDAIGNELLQIGAPQIEAFKRYREQREAEIKAAIATGATAADVPIDQTVNPPGTDVSFFTAVNIRKS